jgi:MOSC domain-containing protein
MIMKMYVAELWRYPVKSLAGEPLESAEVSADGIPGDRVVQVYDAGGRIVTARTAPRLLGLKATLGPMGEPLVSGRPWTAPEVAAEIEAAAGAGARLARDDGPDRFDVLPLLVATDGAVNALGLDRRRFRPNILVAGVNGLAEREWPGRRARISGAIIGFKKLRGRCVMTTYDPDSLEHDPTVLRRIVQEMGGRLALDSYVVRGGRVALGDPLELL